MSGRRTPVRSSLRATSPLHESVQVALRAVRERDCFDETVRADFADSRDLDAALRVAHPREKRWDYLVGHRPSGTVVGVEPHSTKESEIGVVIGKRRAALDQLRPHLRPGASVADWLWVASGRARFVDTEKARRQLDQAGIRLVGGRISLKHLPAARRTTP